MKPLHLPSWLLSFLLYLLPVYLIFRIALFYPNTMYVGSNGDASQFIWYLGWFWHAVFTGQNPLVSYAMNYPFGVNLIANTSVVAESILFGPLFYLIGPIFTYNFLMISSFLLLGFIGQWIFRKLGVRNYLAILGGLLFETSSFAVNQTIDGHLNLICAYVIVLALVYFLLASCQDKERHEYRYGIILGLLLTMLFYTSLEMFAYMVLVVGAGFIVFGMVYKKLFLSFIYFQLGKQALIAILLSGLLILPGLYMFFYGAMHLDTHSPIFKLDEYVTHYDNLFLPTHAQGLSFFGQYYEGGNLSESDAYLGLPFLFLMVYCLPYCKKRLGKVLLILSGIFILLSLGPHLHVGETVTSIILPWMYIQKLPLLDNVLPSRIMALADISIILWVILALENQLRAESCWLKTRLLKGLLILSLLSWLPHHYYGGIKVVYSPATLAPEGELYPILENKPVAIMTYDYGSFSYYMAVLAMAHYGFPVVNAYQVPYIGDNYSPPKNLSDMFLFFTDCNNLSLAQTKQKLERFVAIRHPEFMVLFPYEAKLMPPVLNQALTSLYGEPTDQAGVVIWQIKN